MPLPKLAPRTRPGTFSRAGGSRAAALAAAIAATVLALTTGATPADAAQAGAVHRAATSLLPTYLKGTVVNSVTGNPVPGVVVTVRDPVSLDVLGTDTTNSNGVFRVDGLDSDEYAVKYNGSRRSYETGFLACDHTVVPHSDDACTFAPGPVGKARLDHL